MRATPAQHIRAKELSNQAFIEVFNREPVLGERQYLQAVGCVESTYGAGWKDEGDDSNNMGAIQGGKPPCDDNEFQTTDTHADGSVYSWCYKEYATPLDGWIDLVKTLYIAHGRDSVRRFAAQNDFAGAAAMQRSTRYYEAPLERYQASIDSCLREFSTVLGEPYAPKVGADLG